MTQQQIEQAATERLPHAEEIAAQDRYALGKNVTEQFMREAQAHAARRARESHLRNGTYPPKGWYSPNLQKGTATRFKRKEI